MAVLGVLSLGSTASADPIVCETVSPDPSVSGAVCLDATASQQPTTVDVRANASASTPAGTGSVTVTVHAE